MPGSDVTEVSSLHRRQQYLKPFVVRLRQPFYEVDSHENDRERLVNSYRVANRIVSLFSSV